MTLAGQDRTGNALTVQPSNNSFTIDTTAPTATLAYSPALPGGSYAAGAFTVTATFSEAMAPTPTIAIAGPAGVNNVTATNMSGSGTVWTFSRTIVSGNDGTFSITLAGTDEAGNSLTTQPGSNTFDISVAPPPTVSLAFSPVAEGAGYRTGAFTVTATAMSGSGTTWSFTPVETVLTYSAPAEGGSYGADVFRVTATFSESINASPKITITGPSGNNNVAATNMTGSGTTWTFARTILRGNDGLFTLQITGTPTSGNVMGSQPSNNTFTIDTLAPTVSLALNAPGAGANHLPGPITFTATFSEPVGGTPRSRLPDRAAPTTRPRPTCRAAERFGPLRRRWPLATTGRSR
ncbi:MAG: hypothetical protein HY816_13130 [Candidatus Wallbacteria bacterium]|nr:hypothetical protein [Candidatus Wallbacteria bacterium]